MKLILIGNYPQDRQESMERFAQMLLSGFCEAGLEAQIWRPNVVFGGLFETTNVGIGKWLGYVDKWVIYPLILRWRLLNKSFRGTEVRFHVCDHSNSPYLKYLPADRTGITCHDVLAIRGAMGFADAYVPASGPGKILQRWILDNLNKAKKLAAVSKLTLSQLTELTPEQISADRGWQVIHNAFNADFKLIEATKAKALVAKAGVNSEAHFILHVGSNLARKNRKLLLDMVAVLGSKWNGNICYAGKAVDEALMEHACRLGLQDRVISVVKPDHKTLEALYNVCDAFIFPSYSEGFGWPVIEAQACGAPVIASNLEPLPEISGGAAIHADPNKPKDFAAAFLSLVNKEIKTNLIQKGFENCSRFAQINIIDSYLALHNLKRK